MDFRLKIADIVFWVSSRNPHLVLDTPPVYKRFICNDEADVIVSVEIGALPSLDPSTAIFLSGGNWDLYMEDGKWVIPICFPPGSEPQLMAKFDSDYLRGQILLNEKKFLGSSRYLFTYPLDEFLMINLMADGRGVELHACAVILEHQNLGLVFTGMSEAGKSTIARLWQQVPGTTILSDDRVIVRKNKDGFTIYGTPWHGDALGAAARSMLIDRIFVLGQAVKNELNLLEPLNAVTSLFLRSFSPFWSPTGIRFTLGFFEELSRSVPCYEFGFLPDESAIEFLLEQITM